MTINNNNYERKQSIHIGQGRQRPASVPHQRHQEATTDRGYTKQDGTVIPDRTEWHNIVAWRSMAEVCEKYVHKGDLLYIEGKITNRSWEKDGTTHYITEIVAEVVELFPKSQNGAQEAPGAQKSPAGEWQPNLQPINDDEPF